MTLIILVESSLIWFLSKNVPLSGGTYTIAIMDVHFTPHQKPWLNWMLKANK